MANQANPKDQGIKTTEHKVGKILGAHVVPTPAGALSAATRAQPGTRPRLQNLRAMPMAALTKSNIDLFSLNQNLQLNLLAWKPSSLEQKSLKKDLGAELNALNDILFQQTLAENAEKEDEKSLVAINLSDPQAPSLEKLREDLATITELEPTLPPALAQAVEKFTEEFDKCFPAEAPAHPKPHASHAHDHTPDANPQPDE